MEPILVKINNKINIALRALYNALIAAPLLFIQTQEVESDNSTSGFQGIVIQSSDSQKSSQESFLDEIFDEVNGYCSKSSEGLGNKYCKFGFEMPFEERYGKINELYVITVEDEKSRRLIFGLGRVNVAFIQVYGYTVSENESFNDLLAPQYLNVNFDRFLWYSLSEPSNLMDLERMINEGKGNHIGKLPQNLYGPHLNTIVASSMGILRVIRDYIKTQTMLNPET